MIRRFLPRRLVGVAIPVLVVAALAGCGKKEGGPGGAPGGGGGGFTPPPTPVEVAQAEVGPLSDRFETVGSLDATERITVVSEIDGAIQSLPFQEGAEVARGTLLAKLDDRERRADLARAEAVRDQRKTAWERVKRVVEQNAGAPQDLDDAAAALAVAEADVVVARTRLDKTRIVAPFDGMVGPRAVSPGAFARAGQEIAELARVSEIEVHFSMPERYAGRLHRGERVTVSTPAFPNEKVEGTVEVVDPIVDRNTRNLGVIARVPNSQRHLRPGMSANVAVDLSTREAAITVPAEAVFAQGDQFLVYVVQDDGTVMTQPLQLGVRLADKVEVREGLAAGATVVRAGHQKLYPGAKVMPITSQPGGAPGAGGPGAGGPGGEAGGDAGGPAAGTDGGDAPATPEGGSA
ncbi:MAG: efflux RND transporter periplasmic adaptor subunit [bacterium]